MTQQPEQQDDVDEGQAEQQTEDSMGPSPAHLQVLTLPSRQVGEVTQYPFALVLSGMTDQLEYTEVEGLSRWARECGAESILITPFPIKVE